MSYKKHWDEYKNRSRVYWLAVMFLVLALTVGLSLAVTRFSPILFYVYLFAVGIGGFAICVAGYYRSYVKCPRCEKPFFRTPQSLNTNYYPIFARHCVNCGLAKWSEKDDSGGNLKTMKPE